MNSNAFLMSAARLRKVGRRCKCGCTLEWAYIKRYLDIAERIKCTHCHLYITVRCKDCLSKSACPKKHLFCDACGMCYICTKCYYCNYNTLALTDPATKFCCKCKKMLPPRCNDCMIKRICSCGDQFCIQCGEGCLDYLRSKFTIIEL